MTTYTLKNRLTAPRFVVIGLMIAIVMGVVALHNPVLANTQAAEVGTVKNLKAVRESSTSLKLSWSKNANAKGYVVYRYDKEKRAYKKRSDVSGKSASYTDKNLTPENIYQYIVRAYAVKKGKRQYGSASYWVTARPYPDGSKRVNASKIQFADSKLDIGFLDHIKDRANVMADGSSEVRGKKPVSKAVRWYSSNQEIATVKKDGSIVTKEKTGTCYIYAIAHNGVKGKIKVIVRDCAHPSHFDVQDVQGYGLTLLTAYKEEISEIAGYYHLNRPTKEEMILINDDEVLVEPDEDYNLEPIRNAVTKVLRGIPNESLIIRVSEQFISFNITEITGEDADRNDTGYVHKVKYYYNRDLYDWDPDGYDFDEIAPHWGYCVREITHQNPENDD